MFISDHEKHIQIYRTDVYWYVIDCYAGQALDKDQNDLLEVQIETMRTYDGGLWLNRSSF